jgi:hypothetical protein
LTLEGSRIVSVIGYTIVTDIVSIITGIIVCKVVILFNSTRNFIAKDQTNN